MPAVNVTPNYDFDTEAQNLQRRQALIDALQKQALSGVRGPQQIGPVAAKTPLLAALVPLVEAYAANQAQQRQDQSQADLTKRYGEELRSGMEAYDKTSRGVPAEVLPEGMEGPTRPGIAPDPRKAVFDALASTHPMLRQFAMEQLKEQGKGQLTPKDLLAHANPASIPGMLQQGVAGFQPKRELGFAPPGEVAYDKNSGEIVQPVTQPGAAPAQERGADGELYQRTATGWKKLDNAPKVTVNTGDQAGVQFGKDLAGERSKQISKSYENAQNALKVLDSTTSAQQDLDAGIKSGAPAEINLAISKWGRALGLSDDPSIANTEGYRANMARETMQLVKNLGSGTAVSNTDLKFAEAASGGKITLDDRAMQRLLHIAQQAAGNTLIGHSDLLERAKKAPGGAEAGVEQFEVPFQLALPKDSPLTLNERSRRVELAPWSATATSQKPPGVRRYNPATGRIE